MEKLFEYDGNCDNADTNSSYKMDMSKIMSSQLQGQMQFLLEVDKMKNVARQTLLFDGTREETNAEHSWHFALAAMTLYEHAGMSGVDLYHVVKMAIVHDLVEIYAGDVPAFDISANVGKREREQAAARKLFSHLPKAQADEYHALWEEFDNEETDSAIFAAAVDCLLPFLSNHIVDGHSWRKFSVTKDMVLSRMKHVETAIPALWPFVLEAVRSAIQGGFIVE